MISGKISRKTVFLAVFVLTISLGARAVFINSKSLWLDEAYTLEVSQLSFSELLQLPDNNIPHFPVTFILTKVSGAIFGYSETSLRLPAALITGFAVLPLMLLLSRLAKGKAWFWGGLFWAVAPYAVSLGQEAWVYGPLAGFGILFVSLALEVWRGHRKLLPVLVFIGVAGLFSSQIFVLYIAAGLGLWFVVSDRLRVRFRVPAAAAVILLLILGSTIYLSADEFGRRRERAERAGAEMIVFSNAINGTPVLMGRLIAGGLLPKPATPLLAGKKRLLVYLLILTSLAASAAVSFKILPRPVLYWTAGVILLALLSRMFEQMGPRQLSILWIPAALLLSSASSRYRWGGWAAAAGMVVMLVFYYQLPVYPYHRADWRAAAAKVRRLYREGDSVLLLNRQSGETIWNFYAPAIDAETTENGLEGEHLRSLMSSSERVWVVKDYWASVTPSDVVRVAGYQLEHPVMTGDLMRIALAVSDKSEK